MSPKELLYIEDALGHSCYLKTACKDRASQLQDQELRTFAEQLASRNQQLFDQMYSLLK